MSAIEAASAGVKDMADGSLRITLEFEPRHAKDAYALFGARGTPVAVVALKVGNAASQEPEKPKGGNLSQDAARICQTPEFQDYAAYRGWLADEAGAAGLVRTDCLIQSRAELDHNPASAKRFALLMEAFRYWKETGVTAHRASQHA